MALEKQRRRNTNLNKRPKKDVKNKTRVWLEEDADKC